MKCIVRFTNVPKDVLEQIIPIMLKNNAGYIESKDSDKYTVVIDDSIFVEVFAIIYSDIIIKIRKGEKNEILC